jgi:hypothetical protein
VNVRLTWILGTLAVASTAYADEVEEPTTPTAAAISAVAPGERVTMPPKRAFLHANVQIGLFADNAFDPVSIAPDIWYGVNEKLTVGLVHSSMALLGIMGGIGDSLCIAGDGCGDVYNNVGLDARYEVLRGNATIAVNGGLQAASVDPLQLRLKAGIVGRFRPSPASKLSVDFAPALFFGVTERDGAIMSSSGNKELLIIPVTALYQAATKLSAGVQVAAVVPFENAGDLFFIPVSLGATYQIDYRLSVDVAFTLLRLAGGSGYDLIGGTGFDARTLTLGVGYAF